MLNEMLDRLAGALSDVNMTIFAISYHGSRRILSPLLEYGKASIFIDYNALNSATTAKKTWHGP